MQIPCAWRCLCPLPVTARPPHTNRPDRHVLHQNRSSIAYMGYLVELAGSPGAQSAAAATERGGSSSSSTRPGTAAWVERRPVPDRDGRRDPAGGVGSGAVPPSPRGGTNWLQQLFAAGAGRHDAGRGGGTGAWGLVRVGSLGLGSCACGTASPPWLVWIACAAKRGAVTEAT